MLEQFSAEPPFGGSTTLANPLFNTPFVGQNGTVSPNAVQRHSKPGAGANRGLVNLPADFVVRAIPAEHAHAILRAVQLHYPTGAGQRSPLAGGLCWFAGSPIAGLARYQPGSPQTCLGIAAIGSREYFNSRNLGDRSLRPAWGRQPLLIHRPQVSPSSLPKAASLAHPYGPTALPRSTVDPRNAWSACGPIRRRIAIRCRNELPNRRNAGVHQHFRRRYDRRFRL